MQCIPDQSVTNFNGDGGEHSQSGKRRVDGQKWQRHKKVLVSCHKKAGVADACKYYEAREQISVKEQEKVNGTPNEDEEGKDEDSTYPLPKKRMDAGHYLETRT